jgi:hypothetical protein
MSNLSVGSGVIVVFLITGSPDRVSALSGRVTRDPYPASYPRPPAGGGWPTGRGFLLPFGHRRSLLGHPIPAEELGPPHGRLTGQRPDLDGVTAFRTHEQRPGRVPSVPRGRRCSPRPGTVPGRRPPHLSSNVPAPRLRHSTWQGFTSRGINEGSSNSPVRSSPRPPRLGWNEQPLRLSPELRAPPTRSQTTHVGVGTGQLSTDLEQRSTTSADPPIERVRS